MDSEHQNMIYIFDKMTCSVEAGDAAGLLKECELLEKSLSAYEAAQTNIASTQNFSPDQRQTAHQYLLSTIERVKNELVAKHGSYSKCEAKRYIDSLLYCVLQYLEEDAELLKFILEANSHDPILLETRPC